MDSHALDFMVESLESRQMLAGNVSVEITDRSDLVIDGDDESNQVIVSAAGGLVSVTGVQDTSVNGELNGEVIFNVESGLRDLKVKFRDGEDTLVVFQGEFRNGRFDMGDDNDAVQIQSAQFSGNVRVSLGDGDPEAVPVFSPVHNQAFFAGDANIEGRLSIRGDDTNDLVILNGSSLSGGSRVSLGDGNDTVQVINGQLDGRSSFRLGDGDDQMMLSSTSATGSVRASGGSGSDLFLNDSPANAFDPRLSSFELDELA